MRTTFPNFILHLDFEQFLAFLAKYFVFVYRLGAVEVAANARENLNCELTFGLVAEDSTSKPKLTTLINLYFPILPLKLIVFDKGLLSALPFHW